jgi:hypothetical protein
MIDTYTTSSTFLYVTYSWSGHQHEFPNAKLYTVRNEPTDATDRITFDYCALCEIAYQAWRRGT